MPSKKRARPTSGVDDSAAQPKPLCLERYHLLPLELQHLIISFACIHSTPGTPSTLTPFSTDSATILALCLVNRELRELVQHRLYREVSVTRPSKLYALQQALVERPEMGKLIERLHIGPQDVLPAHWWPLTNAYAEGYSHESSGEEGYGGPFDWLATSLDQSQLPAGFEDRQPFLLDRSPSHSCRDAAIRQAVGTAQTILFADLTQQDGSRSVKVGAILEVQAALDLYLAKIRSMEEENPHLLRLAERTSRIPQRCKDGACGHYPSLILSASFNREFDLQAATSPKGIYRLFRSQLLRHLARTGSTTDRFDHPLIFSRSNFKIYLTVPPGKGHPDYSADAFAAGTRYRIRSQYWDVDAEHQVHTWPELPALHYEDQQQIAALKPARNGALICTATLSETLRLARAVLARTPNLQGLSLTGFLESAVGGGRNTRLSSLRQLSLGPPPVCWNAGLLLQGLQSVVELRIAGIALVAGEIEAITSSKPYLRRLEWSMREPMPSEMELNIAQTLNLLLQDSDSTSSSYNEAHAASDQEEEAGNNNDVEDASQASRDSFPSLITKRVSHRAPNSGVDAAKPSLLVTARLHPADVATALASALSDEVRAAWLGNCGQGDATSAEGAARLLLRENAVPDSGKRSTLQPSKDSTSPVWKEFYEEGREWWTIEGGA